MIKELHKTFGSLAKALEILFIAEGVKPCARQGFYDNELEKVRQFCRENKLYITTSDYKIIIQSETNRGAFSNKGVKAELSAPEKGMIFAYISRSKHLAEKAKQHEQNNDSKALGSALGYPSCCCDFFIKNEAEQSAKNNDYILPILKNSEGFRFPKETNICARYFDYTLLSHFPCSFNCKESINLAKRYLNIILKYDEDLAFQILDILGSAVLYHEFSGVFVLHDYMIEGNKLKFQSMLNTKQGRMFEDLKEHKKLEIIDKNSIRLNNQKISDPDLGVMIFS